MTMDEMQKACKNNKTRYVEYGFIKTARYATAAVIVMRLSLTRSFFFRQQGKFNVYVPGIWFSGD